MENQEQTTLTPEAWTAYIEKTNEEFLAATREQRRVMIARDIKMQVKGKRIRPMSRYFSLVASYDEPNCGGISLYDNQDMRTAINQAPACMVCGIGAIFVTALSRLNKMTYGQFADYGDNQGAVHKYLAQMNLFSTPELHSIESYFENSSSYGKFVRMDHFCDFIIETEGREFNYCSFHSWLADHPTPPDSMPPEMLPQLNQ